jgi:phosphoglycolate phosphatase
MNDSTSLFPPAREKIRGIIFDLDGTLLDTIDDIADAMNTVLASASLPRHPAQRYKQFVGDGVEQLVWRALPADRRGSESVARFIASMREEYTRHLMNKTHPYPGILDMLDRVKTHGIHCAILSNKPHELTVKTVAHLFPSACFEAVYGVRDGVPIKPDPAGVHQILSDLSLTPEQCCYLGDSAVDMHTAHAAGITAIGASWGFRGVDELKQAGADRIIDHPLKLFDFVVQG